MNDGDEEYSCEQRYEVQHHGDPNTGPGKHYTPNRMRETAEIATAALVDTGVITKDDTIDHNKVKRAQEKLAKELENKFDKKIQESGVSCLLFDGRQDNTKVMLVTNDSDIHFPGVVKGKH